MKKQSINELVQNALLYPTKHQEIQLGRLKPSVAKSISNLIKSELKYSEIFIDTFKVRHAIAGHGDALKEAKRGQIAITIDDFRFIPLAIKEPDKIEYGGKNRLGQDVLNFSKKIGNVLVVAVAVRVKSKGNIIVFESMYKKKG